MFEKKDKVRCINNQGFERLIQKGQIYTVYDIDKTGIDIGYSKNFPENLFKKVENQTYNLTEERSELEDIFWLKDLEIYELEDKIAEMNYLQKYWADKLEDKLKELKILKLGFETWYDTKVEEVISSLTKTMDDKTKKEFLKNYSSQAKEKRLVTIACKEEYEQWQKSIIDKEYEVGKLKSTVSSLETKAINLNIINKNHKETIN